VPFIDIPLHTVIKLMPDTYFCSETRYLIDENTGEVTEKVIKKPQLIDKYLDL